MLTLAASASGSDAMLRALADLERRPRQSHREIPADVLAFQPDSAVTCSAPTSTGPPQVCQGRLWSTSLLLDELEAGPPEVKDADEAQRGRSATFAFAEQAHSAS